MWVQSEEKRWHCLRPRTHITYCRLPFHGEIDTSEEKPLPPEKLCGNCLRRIEFEAELSKTDRRLAERFSRR